MQQEAITLKFGVKGGCYQYVGFVCVSVIRMRRQIKIQFEKAVLASATNDLISVAVTWGVSQGSNPNRRSDEM